MKFSPELEKSFTARLSTHNRMSDWGGKPAFGLLPLSAHKQNKEIPSMAVLALFIKTIDGIAYFAIGIFIFLPLCTIIIAMGTGIYNCDSVFR